MGVTLCDAADIVKRLGRALTPQESSAWPGVAEEATVLIEGYLDKEWADDDSDPGTVPAAVPLNVRVVASRMVARTFGTTGVPGGQLGGTMLPGTRSFNSSMGPMGHTTTFGDDVVFGSPWLSKADRLMLRKKSHVEHHPMFQVEATGLGHDYARRYGYGC